MLKVEKKIVEFLGPTVAFGGDCLKMCVQNCHIKQRNYECLMISWLSYLITWHSISTTIRQRFPISLCKFVFCLIICLRDKGLSYCPKIRHSTVTRIIQRCNERGSLKLDLEVPSWVTNDSQNRFVYTSNDEK